jgi:nucleotide-binding universal stress UspA family protein
MAGLVQRLTSLLDDELPVTTAVWHGEVVPSLAAASSDAALVVVQHQRIARRAHGSLRSVTQGVMAQTSAPVLVVPDGWRPRAGVGSPLITVGMPASSAATGVLRAALEEAERLDGRLLVVHAVRHDPSTEPVADDPAGDAWFRQQRLQQAVSRLAGERPEVPVEVAVVADSPAEALVRAAATSALVVVGRRHSRIGAGTHAGHVVHELLTRCPCPVLVVDPLKGSGRAMSVA